MGEMRGYRVQSAINFRFLLATYRTASCDIWLRSPEKQAVVLQDQHRKIDPSLPWHKAHASTQLFLSFQMAEKRRLGGVAGLIQATPTVIRRLRYGVLYASDARTLGRTAPTAPLRGIRHE